MKPFFSSTIILLYDIHLKGDKDSLINSYNFNFILIIYLLLFSFSFFSSFFFGGGVIPSLKVYMVH